MQRHDGCVWRDVTSFLRSTFHHTKCVRRSVPLSQLLSGSRTEIRKILCRSLSSIGKRSFRLRCFASDIHRTIKTLTSHHTVSSCGRIRFSYRLLPALCCNDIDDGLLFFQTYRWRFSPHAERKQETTTCYDDNVPVYYNRFSFVICIDVIGHFEWLKIEIGSIIDRYYRIAWANLLLPETLYSIKFSYYTKYFFYRDCNAQQWKYFMKNILSYVSFY